MTRLFTSYAAIITLLVCNGVFVSWWLLGSKWEPMRSYMLIVSTASTCLNVLALSIRTKY